MFDAAEPLIRNSFFLIPKGLRPETIKMGWSSPETDHIHGKAN
jgi:hypothetical protein